ncbi:4-alpha-glucanotransferase [Brachybacterium sp. EF45031]|uniref:4-alpha-glucanotransferase n=1 Tax=Brachybacterium sillae TaxID=2810536 RepID=UPI00217E041D|nr:4-alpha-glucanotransferase [Brachybacterium sillae]MCS6712638.1 4-alpha-glucanotransferase [Brachybacterium sillae]
MSVDPRALRDLARDLGVGTDYWGWDGTRKEVSEQTLLKVLAALGHDVRDSTDITRIRTERHREAWLRTLPEITVSRQDRESTLPVHVPHGSAVTVHVVWEDGTRADLQQVQDDTPPQEVEGAWFGQASFRLPVGMPLGWHRVVARTERGDVEADLVVTPARLTTVEALGAHRAMGVQAQLYSVRSRRSWGLGDLGDLRDLATLTGAHHDADFLLVNPLHASYPAPPVEPSPYLPVTRRFTDPIYLRIEDVPEYRDLPEFARQRFGLLAEEARAANADGRLLERDPVLEAKRAALEELYARGMDPAREALFEAYRRREGKGLEDFATWCTVAEGLRVTDPASLRDLEDAVVDAARRDHPERIRYHAWVQFLLDEQMRGAQAAARAAGMRIGIMHDLAVGVEQTSADAWMLRGALVQGVGVGAPPDQYNQQGQNWDQPPWHPEGLRRAGYRPWRDMLRSLMRHAGALRIDHVLGLFRLWWIPEGNSPTDGTYVYGDHAAMVGILALEAQRSGTIVIGEDLGTFEPWVREYLADRGILGTSILWFENDSEGRPLPPSQYRRLCLASVNTHDLPPTAGYLAGDHVRVRHELGLLERDVEEEAAADRAAQERMLDAVRAEGLLTDGAGEEETIIALHRHLAAAPSLLLGVSLVDCVGERRMQNQPGTDEEYPNWRIPLGDSGGRPVMLEDLAADERTARLLGAVRQEISAAEAARG